jgi:flagellar motility protein MotE (MotC chaperone)
LAWSCNAVVLIYLYPSEENEFNDEDFLAKLKKQEQRAEARIAEDKKRFADQTAQEKARLEKEQKEKEKELQEKERKKKALQEKKDEIAKAVRIIHRYCKETITELANSNQMPLVQLD